MAAAKSAVPESAQKKREWTLQIVALCEAAVAEVDGQDRDFSSLRSVEADSPARIAALRARLSAAGSRLAPAADTVERMSAAFAPELLEGTAAAVETATVALDSATDSLDEAEKRLSPSGVNTVAGLLEDAEGGLQRAIGALDRVDGTEARLAAATSALDDLVASTADDLAEARAERSSAPDADTGQAIIRAIAGVEAARSQVARPAGAAAGANPVRDLDALSSAVAALDTALASARNQTQRLDHARTALTGTLVSADSQIAALRALVSGSGRRVGAEARTRLSEAERQLMLARAEADPVEALDAARRAVTHARDGDALARYDTMGLGR
jgi:chromosome segregation ATPase